MCNNLKTVYSENYNSIFNYKNGTFARWGKDFEDNPKFSPFGPEILDIEISTICHGINGRPCTHCYKSNTGNGVNMSFETFKKLFDKLPKRKTGNIIITLENGTKIKFNSNEYIELANGNKIKIENLKINDNINLK